MAKKKKKPKVKKELKKRLGFIDVILSTAVSLRKVINLRIKQNKDFYLRPQLHVLLCKPFGQFKSTIVKEMTEQIGKEEVYKVITLTMASIDGTIDKSTKEYVPSIFTKVGGKILSIDEGNIIDNRAMDRLLGVLSDRELSKVMGFKVNKPEKFGGKENNNEFMKIEVIENTIKGFVTTTVIINFMEFPHEETTQKALLSRFLPIFQAEDVEDLFEGMRGRVHVNISDWSGKLREVTITEKAYMRYLDEYEKIIMKEYKGKIERLQRGFITRCNEDIIRLGIFNYLKKNKITNKKEVTISDPRYLIEMLQYTEPIMRNYLHPYVTDFRRAFVEWQKTHPNKPAWWYAKRIGCHESTINRYILEARRGKVTEEEIEEEPKQLKQYDRKHIKKFKKN